MGNPVQNPGYIPGQPSNYSENKQLNELEESENRAYAPQATPDPTPDHSSDVAPESEVPQDGNIFESVSQAYQNQVEQGNIIPETSTDSSELNPPAESTDSVIDTQSAPSDSPSPSETPGSDSGESDSGGDSDSGEENVGRGDSGGGNGGDGGDSDGGGA